MIPGAEPEALTTSADATGATERRVFEALALPYLAHLYKLAVRLTGRTQDAEDAVQETYVKALAAFPSLRDHGRIRPWLSQILTRVVLDRYRSERPEVAVGDLTELDRFSLYDLVWELARRDA
jgi:RNA polymerase sigma-70 factor (ECF subfamily)